MRDKPKCIVVTGRPGSGKTTLARVLGQRLHLPVISRDELKEGYVNTYGVKHEDLPPDSNAVVSNFFFALINHYLHNNISIVAEAAFQHAVWEPHLPAIAERSRPLLVICSLDGEVAAWRHLQRGLADPHREFFHGDQRVTHYRQSGVLLPPDVYRAPEFDMPTIHVSTHGAYAPSLEEIINIFHLMVSP